MIPSREAHDVLGGISRVSASSVRCRASGVDDNEGRLRRAWRAGRSRPRSSSGSAGRSAWVRCSASPATPKPKGSSNARNGYLETSFLPGRRFDDVADFNAQLRELAAAGEQPRRTGRCGAGPSNGSSRTARAMMAFPPVLPDLSWRFATRLPRDHYVRVDTNDYSVHPRAVGRRVEVRVDLDEVS